MHKYDCQCRCYDCLKFEEDLFCKIAKDNKELLPAKIVGTILPMPEKKNG